MINELRNLTAQGSPELMVGSGQGSFASRADNIDHRFRLAEVHSAVEKGGAREFAGFRETASATHEILKNLLRYQRISVAGDFRHVLAGVGIRRFEIGVERVVENGALVVAVVSAHDPARGERLLLVNFAKQAGHERAAEADHRDRRLAASRRFGRYGVLFLVGHPEKRVP